MLSMRICLEQMHTTKRGQGMKIFIPCKTHGEALSGPGMAKVRILLSELVLCVACARGWPRQSPPLMHHFMG